MIPEDLSDYSRISANPTTMSDAASKYPNDTYICTSTACQRPLSSKFNIVEYYKFDEGNNIPYLKLQELIPNDKTGFYIKKDKLNEMENTVDGWKESKVTVEGNPSIPDAVGGRRTIRKKRSRRLRKRTHKSKRRSRR